MMRIIHKFLSSAQGNCSAKSLAGRVIDSSLSSTSHAVLGAGGSGAGGLGVGGWEGDGVEGEGAGDISSTLPNTALPHGGSP